MRIKSNKPKLSTGNNFTRATTARVLAIERQISQTQLFWTLGNSVSSLLRRSSTHEWPPISINGIVLARPKTMSDSSLTPWKPSSRDQDLKLRTSRCTKDFIKSTRFMINTNKRESTLSSLHTTISLSWRKQWRISRRGKERGHLTMLPATLRERWN